MAARSKQLIDLPSFTGSSMEKYPILSYEKQRALGKRVLEQKDEKARELLMLHNMRFVLFIAQKYMPALAKRGGTQLDLNDLVQEGMSGLITAVERWDYRKGCAFTTFAQWWIRHRITTALRDCGLIHIPDDTVKLANRVSQETEKFAAREGRFPSGKEIADMLGIKSEVVRSALADTGMTVESLDELVKDGSYDRMNGGHLMTKHDVVGSERFLPPDLALEAKEELRAAFLRVNETIKIVKTSDKISEKNKEVFLSYYGFGDGGFEKRSLKYMAKRYGVSWQRISQILEGVWKYLNKKSRSKITRDGIIEDMKRVLELECIVDYPVTVS